MLFINLYWKSLCPPFISLFFPLIPLIGLEKNLEQMF